MNQTIIYMRSDPGNPKNRILTRPLSCSNQYGTTDEIPIEFVWDGSSAPAIFNGIFPRHRHPIASCKHDFRCGNARNKAERKFADDKFQIDVGKTSWWITKKIGYVGVRIGAFLGIGSDF